jgi:hypothetical protein
VRPSRAPLPRSTVTASANCKNAVIATAAASSRVGFYSPVTRENADNIRRLGRIAKKPLPLASQKLQLFPQARVILWSRNFAHKSDTVPAGSPSVRASLAGKLRYHCNILNLSLSLSLSLFLFFCRRVLFGKNCRTSQGNCESDVMPMKDHGRSRRIVTNPFCPFYPFYPSWKG